MKNPAIFSLRSPEPYQEQNMTKRSLAQGRKTWEEDMNAGISCQSCCNCLTQTALVIAAVAPCRVRRWQIGSTLQGLTSEPQRKLKKSTNLQQMKHGRHLDAFSHPVSYCVYKERLRQTRKKSKTLH